MIDGPGEWQARMIDQLDKIGCGGFEFGPGINWWPLDKDGNRCGGPFHSTAEFDLWLTERLTDHG